jgi:hypothetical protein
MLPPDKEHWVGHSGCSSNKTAGDKINFDQSVKKHEINTPIHRCERREAKKKDL